MSRRRKGNKLLGRILLISVAAHVVIVPVLARYGVFQKLQRDFAAANVTVVPAPPEEKAKQIAKRAVAKKETTQAKKSTGQTARSTKTDPNQPKVVASNAPPSGAGDTDPVIDPNGNGKVGVPPTSNQGSGGADPSGTGTDTTKPKVDTVKSPETKPTTPVENEPATTTTTTTKPHIPVFGLAEPTSQPQPEIPDDLRLDQLDKTVTILVEVSPDGVVENASVQDSCGVDELDRRAVQSAKKWRFRPATQDGTSVASKVRLHFRFKVEL